ncbi:LPS O-antigen chain length determinant protein WzzB [Pseudomonas sp. PSB11]|uniref:LPS O-antigen chain length determinant protein WzzB n=1 Tax=Pseudomonas sp. PSB11 TaxID=2021969 RepID=UPI00166055EC|nr:Wzz/FepE/Etk N-terminal domain-containing protein [Pseudomonas sp. PSB11]MBD0679884.1 hypothetical protein [Pseudomonas sp. PSB11]
MLANQRQYARNDEINVFETLQQIFSQGWLILGVVGVFSLVAIVYAYFSVPVYEAKVYILPPTQSQIVNFNIGRTKSNDLAPYSVKEIYDVFLRNLQSESLRRNFFFDVYLPSLSENERRAPQDVLYANFSSRLIIVPPGKELADRYSVAFQASDPKQAADWTGKYVKEAGDNAKQEVIQNAQRQAEGIARNLDQKIAMYRDRARKSREDAIIQLREALRIAEAINLEKPLIISGNLSAEMSGSMEGQLVYMRGTKALKAEIENLETRKTEDPFIVSLRKYESNSTLLKNLNIRAEDVAVYREDGEIKQPDSPIKPKKIIIYVLGILLGVAVGLICAFVRVFILRNKSGHREIDQAN